MATANGRGAERCQRDDRSAVSCELFTAILISDESIIFGRLCRSNGYETQPCTVHTFRQCAPFRVRKCSALSGKILKKMLGDAESNNHSKLNMFCCARSSICGNGRGEACGRIYTYVCTSGILCDIDRDRSVSCGPYTGPRESMPTFSNHCENNKIIVYIGIQ